MAIELYQSVNEQHIAASILARRINLFTIIGLVVEGNKERQLFSTQTLDEAIEKLNYSGSEDNRLKGFMQRASDQFVERLAQLNEEN